jgi:hypothetical protein
MSLESAGRPSPDGRTSQTPRRAAVQGRILRAAANGDAPRTVPSVGRNNCRDSADTQSPERMQSRGAAGSLGSFHYYFADQRWEWWPQMEGAHDAEPSAAIERVMTRQHPEDLARLAATLERVRHTPVPVSGRQRITGIDEHVHDVVVIGEQLCDTTGSVIGARGFWIDLTPTAHRHQELVSAAVAEIGKSRAAIEQAKGMLMFVYRIDADAAFELLRWRSQVTNTKLRALAEQLAVDFLAVTYRGNLPPTETYHHLLLTAHHRVRAHA